MKRTLIMLITIFVTGTIAMGQVINVQGVLRDNNNKAVNDGSYNITFRIYNSESGGTAQYTEIKNVNIVNGVYSETLDVGTALSGSSEQWLSIQISGDSEMSRVQLHVSPYEQFVIEGQENIFPVSGSVGIGTLAPVQKLDVNGSVKANNFYGQLIGDVDGNVNGSSTSCSGQAATVNNGMYTNVDQTIGVHNNSNGVTTGIKTFNGNINIKCPWNTDMWAILQTYAHDGGESLLYQIYQGGGYGTGPHDKVSFLYWDDFYISTSPQYGRSEAPTGGGIHLDSHKITFDGTTQHGSDGRLKDNKIPIIDALKTLSLLEPVNYDKFRFSMETGERIGESYKEAGLIAQDVLEIPELSHFVSEKGYGDDPSNPIGSHYYLSYNNIFVYSLAAIKELDAEKTILEAKVETLEQENNTLENRVKDIEKKMEILFSLKESKELDN